MRTRRPRFSRSRPIEAAVKPLPNELTTPPVTKMCLVMVIIFKGFSVQKSGFARLTRRRLGPFTPARDKSSIVFRGVDANGRELHDADLNRGARFQGPPLFRVFQSFQAAYRHPRQRSP